MADFGMKYNAQGAYDVAVAAGNEKMLENLKEIDQMIQRAAAAAQFSIIYDKQVEDAYSDGIKDLLRLNYGYSVKEKVNAVTNKPFWVISWEHPGEISND